MVLEQNGVVHSSDFFWLLLLDCGLDMGYTGMPLESMFALM